jgi:hypothetical protein
MFPQQIPSLRFKNPVLTAFSNAIWHCSSAAEGCVVLNEALAKAPEYGSAEEQATLLAAYMRPKTIHHQNCPRK